MIFKKIDYWQSFLITLHLRERFSIQLFSQFSNNLSKSVSQTLRTIKTVQFSIIPTLSKLPSFKTPFRNRIFKGGSSKATKRKAPIREKTGLSNFRDFSREKNNKKKDTRRTRKNTSYLPSKFSCAHSGDDLCWIALLVHWHPIKRKVENLVNIGKPVIDWKKYPGEFPLRWKRYPALCSISTLTWRLCS